MVSHVQFGSSFLTRWSFPTSPWSRASDFEPWRSLRHLQSQRHRWHKRDAPSRQAQRCCCSRHSPHIRPPSFSWVLVVGGSVSSRHGGTSWFLKAMMTTKDDPWLKKVLTSKVMDPQASSMTTGWCKGHRHDLGNLHIWMSIWNLETWRSGFKRSQAPSWHYPPCSCKLRNVQNQTWRMLFAFRVLTVLTLTSMLNIQWHSSNAHLRRFHVIGRFHLNLN